MKTTVYIKEDNTLDSTTINLIPIISRTAQDKFYSPAFGNVTLTKIYYGQNELYFDTEFSNHIILNKEGKFLDTANLNVKCILWPNFVLYNKYPGDPVKAWKEWEENEALKRFGAQLGDPFYYITEDMDIEQEIETGYFRDNIYWVDGNYFETYELAEMVRDEIVKIFIHAKHGTKE